MTPASTSHPRRALRWIARIVPPNERDTWRREWDAELAYAERARPDRTSATPRIGAALKHAAFLRLRSWRPEPWFQDLKHAARALSHRPGFSAAVVLTLAIGIAGPTVIFSTMRAVFWRPLAFPHPESLVMLSFTSASSPDEAAPGSVSAPDFVDWRAGASSFAGIAAIRDDSYAVSDPSRPAEQISASAVTEEYFPLFDVRAAHGRTLTRMDFDPGAAPVAVLGDALWRERFGGREDVIGSRVMFDGESREIVGVMPAASTLPLSGAFWVPLKFAERDLAGQRGAHYLTVVGRLRPNETVASAQNEMRLLAARIAAASSASDRSSISVVPLARALVGTSVDAPLMLLSGAVVLVFLVACVNVAGLALGASIGRRRDLAVRAALGASRARLARGLLLESTLLATTGGLFGTALAILGTRLIATLRQVTIARLDETRVDAQVLAFAAGLTILAVVLFGVLPAWQAARRGVSGELAAASTRSTLDVARVRLRSVLVATEIGLAAALLVGGGLLARSFMSLAHVPLGFDTRSTETCSLSLPQATYAAPERRAAFMDDLLARVSARSDVEAAGAIFGLPLSDFNYFITVFERDSIRTVTDDQHRLRLQVRVVSPGYFRAIGIPILRGRAIDGRDRPGAPPIAVVNAAAATLLWPDGDALGHRVLVATTMNLGRGRLGGEVVGVAGDTRDFGPGQSVRPTLYVAHSQFPTGFFALVVRPRGEPEDLPGALRAIVAGIDPSVPVFRIRTMAEFNARAVGEAKLYLVLLGLFAGVALALAAVGTYGVIAQNVAVRVREIGVRVALGATSGDISRMVVGRAGRLAFFGLVGGLLLAATMRSVLARILFGVRPLDPWTYLTVFIVIAAVALVASWLPARRAAQVDPTTALRAE